MATTAAAQFGYVTDDLVDPVFSGVRERRLCGRLGIER